jgi:hypothetical protein
MTPDQLALRIDTLIEGVEAQLNIVIQGTQRKLYSDMILLLKKLELDRNGYIRNNGVNRKILRQASSVFDAAFKNSGYKQGLQEYTSAFSKVTAINEAYFATVSSAFKPNAAFIKSLQAEAIRQIETMALNEGLVANVKSPLISILNKNINSGGSFAGMLQEVQGYIVGIDKEGKLLRYSKTWVADALFNFSRAYQQSVTQDLGLNNFYYAGGAIKDTRDFCRERLDQYWKREQIEEWADLDWAGKNPGTTKSSIFVYLGGYNCRHSLIPVHESVVSK